jgi:RNA polymerase sigma-70 factor, ECF subfamily
MALSSGYRSLVAAPSASDKNACRLGGDTAPPSDQHLVVAACSGCRTAFNELCHLYSRRIYRTTFKITKNAQDAEDALQESFLRAFLSLESFEGRASFYTWLTRIAINAALGILRKRHRRLEISLDSTSRQEGDGSGCENFKDLAPDPEQIFGQQQRYAKLMQAIHKLPTDLREAVQTRITEDCSVKEVAYRLNISQAAAKSRLYRARTRLGSLIAARCGSIAIGHDRYASSVSGLQERICNYDEINSSNFRDPGGSPRQQHGP